MAGLQRRSGSGPQQSNRHELPSNLLLVLIGSTWSAVASAIGAMVVALATWLRSDWVFPSVSWVLLSFALPALAAAAWRAFASGQHGQLDLESLQPPAGGQQKLKMRISPEDWSWENLPCFSTLPRLERPSFDTRSLQPNLLRETVVQASVELQPGVRANLPLRAGSSRPPLVIATPSRQSQISATLKVQEGPMNEPEVSELLLEAPTPLTLLNIVPTLVNLHHVVENTRWALFRRPNSDASRRGPWGTFCAALVAAGQMLLMGAELIATVHLTRVTAKPRGKHRHLALRFSGRVSLMGGLLRIPFWAVRLPDFLLPSPHGRLIKLLTQQPLASALIHDHTVIPVAKLAGAGATLVASFKLSAEVTVQVPALELEVCLPDATVVQTTARLGSWFGPLPTLRVSTALVGRVSQGSLRLAVESMSFGNACLSGSAEVTAVAGGREGPHLLETLVQLATSPETGLAAVSGEVIAQATSEWTVREGSVLPDVYIHAEVWHPLMKCAHKLWGAARGPTAGGSVAVRAVQILRSGRCAHGGVPAGDIHLACTQVEIPIAEPESESGADSPQSSPRSARARVQRGGEGVVAAGVPSSTFRTGSTVTALGLSAGTVNCRLRADSESRFTASVEYSCRLTVDTEADIGYFPELGVPWSESVQGQASALLEGCLLAEVDTAKCAMELLPTTSIRTEFWDTAVSVGNRALHVPDGTTVALSVASCIFGLRGLQGEPCMDVHWHCGSGKSPTLAVAASDLPALELLAAAFRDGMLRVRVSSVGRVRIEDTPPHLLAASSLSALVPAVSVVQEHDRKLRGCKGVADWKSISAWLDPLSPEGSRRWGELLQSPELEEKVILLCCIVAPDLQPVAKRLFTQIHRLMQVLQEEGITGLRDVIPAEKLASVLARMVSSEKAPPQQLFAQLYRVVKGAVEASGVNIPQVKELLITHIPLLEDFPFELDRVLRILDLTLAPTPPMPPIAGQYAYPVARRQQHQSLLRGLPSAAELYAAVDDRRRPLQPKWAGAVATVAPLLTCQQLEYALSKRSDWPYESLARLTYVYELKKRVKQLSRDWGGVLHFSQAQLIALFLGNVVHASLRWPERAISDLPQDAQFLRHLRDVTFTARVAMAHGSTAAKREWGGQSPEASPQHVPKLPLSLVEEKGLRRVRPEDSQWQVAGSGRPSPSPSSKGPREQVINGSLLGPGDVAALLKIVLASVSQSYLVQENFRMLLELTLSQPPNFLRGVLYELSDNGSQRNLTQMLLRLVDVRQDAFQTPVDIVALFESQLGIVIPRRSDYVAGGRWCRQSYYQEMFHAAAMILEEAEPYLAVQSHVQVALPPEEMLSCPGAGLDKGLSPGVEMPTKRAIAAIREADDRARAVLTELRGGVAGGLRSVLSSALSLGSWHSGSAPAASAESLASATAGYFAAFAATRAVLRQETCITLGREWFRSFWQRNHEALIMECLVRAVQEDVDAAREWLAVQPGMSAKALEQHQWGLGSWENEQWLIDCIIDITYFFAEDRERIRSDPLVRLLIANDPAERYDFTVISVMGVVTQGEKGLELENVYQRYSSRRGVTFIRADTGIAKSHEYNAAKVEEAVRKVRTKAWGIVGYSQGSANALKAESNLCGGTPEQRRLVSNLACRNFLFPAANGAVQATCGEWKVTRVIVECEKLMKHYQASFSSALQETFLDLLWTALSSRGTVSFLGGFHSLSHQGVQTLWREAQHKDGVPTTNIRGVVEEHTLPESLELMAAWHSKQLESPLHDTQVALDEAVGHPVHVHNANSSMLARCDLGGAVQRMSHWAPLDEATEFITTESDIRRRIYGMPKDRFIYPWIELNARFGFVPKVTDDEGAAALPTRERMLSGGHEAPLKDERAGPLGRPPSRNLRTGSPAHTHAHAHIMATAQPSPSVANSPRVIGPPATRRPSFGQLPRCDRVDSGTKLNSLVRRQRHRSHKHQRQHQQISRTASSPSLPPTSSEPHRHPLRAACSSAVLSLSGQAGGLGEAVAYQEPEEEAESRP